LQRVVKEDERARYFLLTKVLVAGMPSARLAELLQGEYAEAADLQYLAAAMQGTIGVEPPADELAVKCVRYYGQGSLKMKVHLYYLDGKRAPHYKLLQSWV
jgi:hypothetical protein